MDCHTNVLEFCDDKATEYMILSHQWMVQEVDYDEMVGLAKLDREERVGLVTLHQCLENFQVVGKHLHMYGECCIFALDGLLLLALSQCCHCLLCLPCCPIHHQCCRS